MVDNRSYEELSEEERIEKEKKYAKDFNITYESDEEVDKLFDDKVIGAYLDKRLAILAFYKKIDNEEIDSIIEGYNGNIKPIIDCAYDYCCEIKDKIPDEYIKNILEFVCNSKIRFSKDSKQNGVYNKINEIVSLVNSSRYESSDYLCSEGRKFFRFGDKGPVLYDVAETFKLEANTYTFLQNILLCNNYEFVNEFVFDYKNYNDYIHIINYLLNDKPELFQNERFRKRIKAMVDDGGALDKGPGILLNILIASPLSKYGKNLKAYKKLKYETRYVLNDIEKKKA